MKKILSLAVFVAALFSGLVTDAVAQTKVADLNFRRTEDRAGTTIFSSYDIANGFRGFTAANPASAYSDTTQALPVFDHFYRFNNHGVSGFPGSGTLADSVFFGTLTLEGTQSTIDSLTVTQQISSDGTTWVTCDSLPASQVVGTGTNIVSAIAGTTVSVIATTAPEFAGATRATLLFYGYPNMKASGITRNAIRDVNYVRFIVLMTGGDLYNAGRYNGVRARFTYPTK